MEKLTTASVEIAGNVTVVSLVNLPVYWDGVCWSPYPPDTKITIVEAPNPQVLANVARWHEDEARREASNARVASKMNGTKPNYTHSKRHQDIADGLWKTVFSLDNPPDPIGDSWQ